ncbi:MAG: hypothetical protein U0176_02660 [Bacteroidia bacterium]
MRKGTLMVVMFLGWLFGPPSNVQKAGEAYQAKRFQEAASLYAGEMENYLGQQVSLNFNQAQCWMRLDSNTKALNLFSNCTQSYAESRQVASWSWNQVGTMLAMGKAPKPQQQPGGAQPGAANPGMAPGMQPGMNPMAGMNPGGAQQPPQVSREDLELALNSFKEALKLDHANEIARYNYELIKRKLEQQDQNQNQNQDQQQQQQQQQQQDQQQQNQNQQNKPKPQPQENQGNQQQQQQQGEGKDPMEMSMEEAERILSAMNSNEKKFLQQLERGKKHKTYNDDGPNW